jgi:hypothetical protein
LSLPSDGHPSYRNDGTQDLQPIFDPTTGVPSQGGVGLVPVCGGGAGSVSGYCAAGYDEIIAFSTDGLQTLYRFGHNYNTGSNPAFGVQNAVGVVSQDGKMLAWTGDFMDTRGDHGTGSVSCANPLRASYQPSAGGCVALNDFVMSVTGNANGSIYKITATGSATQGSCAAGQVVEAAVPAWSACQGLGSTCTDGSVVFTNQGPNSCRGDIAVMAVTSAQPAP